MLIDGIRKTILKLPIQFLRPSKDAWESVEMEATLTIQMLVLKYHKLVKHVGTPQSNVQLDIIKHRALTFFIKSVK